MNKFLKLLSVTAIMGSASVANAGEAGKMYFQVGAGYIMSKDTFTATGFPLLNGVPGIAGAYQLAADKHTPQRQILGTKALLVVLHSDIIPSDKIRTDLAFLYTSKSATFVMPFSDFTLDGPPTNISWSSRATDFKLMANAYYDLQTSSSFTPFVTAGVGGSYGSANINDATLLAALTAGKAPGYVPLGAERLRKFLLGFFMLIHL